MLLDLIFPWKGDRTAWCESVASPFIALLGEPLLKVGFDGPGALFHL